MHCKKSFVPAIFKVFIDHLFDNLACGKWNYCFGKKSGESLEFWIQKSVQILSIAPPFNIPVMRYQSCCLSCEMSFVPKNVWRSNFKTIVHLCSRVYLFKKFTVNRHMPKIRYLFFLLSFRWKKPSMLWETQNLGCIEWLLVITLVSSLVNWTFEVLQMLKYHLSRSVILMKKIFRGDVSKLFLLQGWEVWWQFQWMIFKCLHVCILHRWSFAHDWAINE